MRLQGYLAHKKQNPPRTLQQDYISGHMVALGEGQFLMSEVPLQVPSNCVRCPLFARKRGGADSSMGAAVPQHLGEC